MYRTVFALLLLATTHLVVAQVVAPPPPKEFDVTLRYRIAAARNERLEQYFALIKFLESIGFDKNPGPESEPEDPTETRMTGRISSANARKLLRDRHIKSILLVPSGYAVPREPDKLIKVQLELNANLTRNRQRQLADQVLAKLQELGFKELVGYDHRHHTRLLGWIPAGNLDTLLLDLRQEPSGWFLPLERVAELPDPLRNVSPIEVSEVMPEPDGVAPAREVPKSEVLPLDTQKIAPDLRPLAIGEGLKRVTRMEVILNYVPAVDDDRWRAPFDRLGIIIEGRMGPIVTIRSSTKAVAELTTIPIVSVVRLPRPADNLTRLPIEGKEFDALKATGLDVWHRHGRTGRGVRVGIIDGDFRGYETLVGKGLPKTTRYVDLTSERNGNLQPDEFASVAGTLGSGTQCALALAKAAPDVEMTLIRIDPSCPYQLLEVARAIEGQLVRSENIKQRDADLVEAKNNLQRRWKYLLQERKEVFDDFSDTPEAQAKRDALLKKQAQLEADEEAYRKLLIRFQELKAEVLSLRGIKIVTSSLVWNDGYPVCGGSGMTRWLDDKPFDKALWFQAAGNARGQAWNMIYRDEDNNGVLEFAPSDLKLRPERWTNELNFIAWEPHGQKVTPDLPNKATIRVSVQWQEPHDPSFWDHHEDAYLEPLAKLKLVILRQRDPSGKNLATDDLEVIAVGTDLPQRLENRPTYAIYEQTVEFTVSPQGRYALRVEGDITKGIRPSSAPNLSELETTWEFVPRVFVSAADANSKLLGRPIWTDYFTESGTIGMPADSYEAIVVGSADEEGKPSEFSSRGAPMGSRLASRPDIIMYDRLGLDLGEGPNVFGSGLSTPFAAGHAALTLNERMTLRFLRKTLQANPGRLYSTQMEDRR